MNVNVNDYYEVFKRDGGFCRYCGNDMLRNFSTFASATMDHVTARSKGGGDEPSNLVLACPGCNQHLSHQGSLTSFEERREYLAKVRRERMHKLESLRNELRKKKTDVG